ncbi:MAG: LCP family protein [Eubacteriales bacterium]|nr:LCP family protein [Eubacteriales bacterium]MDY3941311.1 LCP family protein [Eubacteriales bacterium]
MQKKKNNNIPEDDVSMYAPQEDELDDVYDAETKIYRIKKHTKTQDETPDTDDEKYDPYADEADTEDEDALGEEAFSENEAYFDDAYYDELKRKQKVRRKKGRLSRSQRGLIVALSIVYLLVLLLAAWLIFYRPAQPGGHEVPFDTNPVQPDTPDTTETDPAGKPKDNNAVVNGDYKVEKGIYNILLVGHDRAATLADVTMLINVNENKGTITVMQIPRDTYVDDFATNKVNAAYSTYYGMALKEGAKDPYLAAVQSYAELLEQNLCINIHHAAVLNLDGLINIVDILGGVELYVPQRMYYSDPEQGLYIDLQEGWQTLDGKNAENFVRFRSGYVQQDLGRINAQKIFLTALFEKVKASISISNTAKLTQVAGEIFNNLHTDMTASDIMYYGKFVLGVDLANLNMTTIPGNVPQSHYVINRKATLAIINEYFNIYNTEIGDAIFDRNGVFCPASTAGTNAYYAEADNTLDEMHNGQDISDDSIYIP